MSFFIKQTQKKSFQATGRFQNNAGTETPGGGCGGSEGM